MVPCRVCREPVRQGARKCIHCNSVLDWRGWLGISETALALLVALLSVIGATAPRVIELLKPKFSNLKVSVRQVYGQNLELLATNQGNQNSVLLSAEISARTYDDQQIEPVQLQIGALPTVPGGQSAVFQLAIHPVLVPAFLNWPYPKIKSAKLKLLVDEYQKDPQTREIDVPVEKLRQLCRATEDNDNLSRHAQGQATEVRTASRCI
jgi:hypothetical protein